MLKAYIILKIYLKIDNEWGNESLYLFYDCQAFTYIKKVVNTNVNILKQGCNLCHFLEVFQFQNMHTLNPKIVIF